MLLAVIRCVLAIAVFCAAVGSGGWASAAGDPEAGNRDRLLLEIPQEKTRLFTSGSLTEENGT